MSVVLEGLKALAPFHRVLYPFDRQDEFDHVSGSRWKPLINNEVVVRKAKRRATFQAKDPPEYDSPRPPLSVAIDFISRHGDERYRRGTKRLSSGGDG